MNFIILFFTIINYYSTLLINYFVNRDHLSSEVGKSLMGCEALNVDISSACVVFVDDH